AVMGFLPVLARLPRLLARISTAAQAVIARPPDVLVIIDSPDFTHRVARRVRRALPQLPIINYVSPTVWAWRPGRARHMRAYVDHVLALLPFEPRAHRDLGGPPCTYVGHPLIERRALLEPSAEDTARRDQEPPLVVALPGSRRSEVERLLDVFGETFARVERAGVKIEAVLPAVPHLEAQIAQKTAQWSTPVRIVRGEAEKYRAFHRARAALAASGTVTLELGLARTPAVVAYKVSAVEKAILQMLVKTRWASLVNIILEREAYREFLQERATAELMSEELFALLAKGPRRDAQLAALGELRMQMELPDGQTPARLAAQTVLDVVAGQRKTAP
ncbi:MAG: lipid-A-disaccharide synthase, partial [Alphaproteobacteria bacterium]|nr:lipid-A-disaccharide synthase [Alphaproteobacteria bacterium]